MRTEPCRMGIVGKEGGCVMIETVEQILAKITPVAKRYAVKAVYLFGSYARGEAREDSDIDLLVDTSGMEPQSLFSLGALYCDLEGILGKQIDLVTLDALEQPARMPSEEVFREVILKERVCLYHAV